jgi:hypothetical protein
MKQPALRKAANFGGLFELDVGVLDRPLPFPRFGGKIGGEFLRRSKNRLQHIRT